MADEVDVETTLLGIIVGALYPNGTSQPSSASVAVSVFRGWPTVNQMEAAKNATSGLVNVSITTRSGSEKNTSRYPINWQQTSVAPVHTLTVSVNNNVITFGGTVAVPQNVLVLIGQNKVYNYAVQANDTLNTIAAAVATLINADFSGTVSSGAVITVASGAAVKARIASSGTVIQEVGRQEKVFQISIWAPPCNVASQDADTWRTAVARIIDPALKKLIRIVLPDQTFAHMKYERTIVMDAAEMQGLYRRDLYFWVEYPTTITQTAYEIGVFQDQLTAFEINATTEDLSTQGQDLTTPPAGSATLTTNY